MVRTSTIGPGIPNVCWIIIALVWEVIIIQHTFGIPGPIEEVLTITKKHNILVIEDCAHALGSTYAGKPLGTFGDAAILSFGRDKCVSSIFGGAVITKDKHRAQLLQDMQNARPLPPTRWVLQQLLHPVLFSIILPIYFFHGLGKALLVGAQRIGLLSRAVAIEEREGKRPVHMQYAYSPALALLLIQQLEKLDRYIQRREEIAGRYQSAFGAHGDTLPYLRFPIVLQNRDELILTARSQHVLLGDWYDAALVPSTSTFWAFQYIPGSCPNAEALSSSILNLPTYPSLTDTQVEAMITLITTYGHPINT